MSHHTPTPEMQDCIESCLDCFRTCEQTALTHCIEMGGKHVEPAHLRLMLDCALICETSAKLMLRHSDFHTAVCKTCAEICRACAESCRSLDEMEECARACERCAESCERMAGVTQSPTSGRHPGAHQHQ